MSKLQNPSVEPDTAAHHILEKTHAAWSHSSGLAENSSKC